MTSSSDTTETTVYEQCVANMPGEWRPGMDNVSCRTLCVEPYASLNVREHDGRVLGSYYSDAVSVVVLRGTVAEVLAALRRRVTVDPWPWGDPTPNGTGGAA